MFKQIEILKNHGRQYIPDVTQAQLPDIFRGRPEINPQKTGNEEKLARLCPTGAILLNPFRLDLGKCTFCGECAFADPQKVRFTNDYKIATNDRQKLMIAEGEKSPIEIDSVLVRKEITKYFKNSLKLRQISAGGDNSCEWELAACGNANFDMGRFGIEFVASPRHADGIVITGPVTENMAEALKICYDAVPAPKLVILCGVDAISGGIFADSPALKRNFLEQYPIDLYVPGNPVHPLTFINGVLSLLKRKFI